MVLPGVEGPVVNYPLNADTVMRGGYSVLYTHADRPEQVPRPWENISQHFRLREGSLND
jgi:hypothetical protein